MSSYKLTWKHPKINTQPALQEAGELLLDASNQKAPIDEGVLINSGDVAVSDCTASVFYNTPYARRQHEELTWNHPNGREAKFLEKALREQEQALIAHIGSLIKRQLGAT